MSVSHITARMSDITQAEKIAKVCKYHDWYTFKVKKGSIAIKYVSYPFPEGQEYLYRYSDIKDPSGCGSTVLNWLPIDQNTANGLFND